MACKMETVKYTVKTRKLQIRELDDMKAILKSTWCWWKKTLVLVVSNHLLSEMGLFTLHNCCVSRWLD